MQQRVTIAMALSTQPRLLVLDEPTTALDVTIQAQILELIKDLKARMGTSVILITHDLGVVAGMTDKIIVMYAGKVFEQAPTSELFATPANPYTKGLLKSVPDPAHEQGKELYQIPGLPPDVAHLPPGCADLTHRRPVRRRRRAAAGDLIPVLRGIDIRLLDLDLAPLDVELVGDDHREHVADALADLGILRDDGDDAIGRDADEGDRRERGRRPAELRERLGRIEVKGEHHPSTGERGRSQEGAT